MSAHTDLLTAHVSSFYRCLVRFKFKCMAFLFLQVHPKAPLLQILRVAGAQEELFTLKEVMHYLGQYIMMKQLYDKQRQHIVHCQDDPLGELLEVGNAAKNLSVGKDSNESPSEDPGQVSSVLISSGQALIAGSSSTGATQSCSQRRPRDPDEDSSEGLPRSACKRPKLDVTLEEWDLSGLPWWFLGNLRSNYNRRSNGSTDIHTNQDEDTAIVSDTTDDLWFLNEAESEQVSVEMEAVLEQGSDADSPHEEEETGKDSKDDRKMQEDQDDDSQCLSDDTDTEISTQDAWQCSECRKFNTPLQRYCMRCWALRKDWYKDSPRLVHSISVPDIPACSSRPDRDEDEEEEDDGIDMPDCLRTVSDPVVLPSHHVSRNIPPSSASSSKGKGPSQLHHHLQESSEGDSQDTLDMETECQPEAILEPCKLCRVRPRNGNIIHGRTAHLITCFPCARRLHKFHAPCPGCGQVIQKVIKTFIA
uniref:MDM4 regulator of p53 n=1 Tax=Cyprinus carpio TaxID=7962 RepID=A0A8C2GRV2_CYPCA